MQRRHISLYRVDLHFLRASILSRALLFLSLLACLLYSGPVRAQYENIWAFGSGAGLDFSGGAPVAIATGMDGFGEANASVCDRNGQLLFCTEGSYVWDRNGNLMPNGSGLTPFTSATIPVTSSSSQGTVIVPFPGQSHRYFIFSVTDVEMGADFGKLYYSIVNMELNGGLGDVETGAKAIFVSDNLTECVTAVAGERCNVWLVVRSTLTQQFRAYDISESGLNTQPVISPAAGSGTGGYLALSPNRKKLAVGTGGSFGLLLYDFDAAAGTMDNLVQLLPFSGSPGVAFSPDNTRLYAASAGNLYQFTVSSGNAVAIANSQVVLNNSGNLGSQLKAGPDNRIYFRTPGYADRLGAIAQPNLPGPACNVINEVVTLLPGSSMSIGLPNTVAVVPRDTVYTQQVLAAPCFAGALPLTSLNDTTGWGYLWSTGSTDAAVEVTQPGTYWVRYWSPPCRLHTDTFTISFPNGRLPILQVDSTCRGVAAGRAYVSRYPGDTTQYTYLWTNAAGDTLSTGDTLAEATSGNYQLHVFTALCDTVLGFYIPEVGYTVGFLSDRYLCEGSALTIQNTSSAHFTHFTWLFGDGTSLDAVQPPAHVYPAPGHYEISLIGRGAICLDTLKRMVTVDSRSAGAFHADPHDLCTGGTVHFAMPTDSTQTTIQWEWGDGGGVILPPEPVVSHAYDQAGAMAVLVRSRYRACPDTTFTDTVQVHPFPYVDLGSDTGLCQGAPGIVLGNRYGPPGPGDRYLWNTGDTTATLLAVHPGTYKLTVSSGSAGCSTTEEIEVKKDCYIDIPNAFTPNGDGVNDFFFPRQLLSRKLTRFHLKVFNRWGQVVFETARVDGRGWDGKFNGRAQPGGVYLYQIEAEIDGRATENYQGNVTLIR